MLQTFLPQRLKTIIKSHRGPVRRKGKRFNSGAIHAFRSEKLQERKRSGIRQSKDEYAQWLRDVQKEFDYLSPSAKATCELRAERAKEAED